RFRRMKSGLPATQPPPPLPSLSDGDGPSDCRGTRLSPSGSHRTEKSLFRLDAPLYCRIGNRRWRTWQLCPKLPELKLCGPRSNCDCDIAILQDNLGYVWDDDQSGPSEGPCSDPFSFYLDRESRNSASRRPDELWGKVRRFWSVCSDF